MVAGRPRTVSYEKEEMIKLGEELLIWATEETDEFRFLFQQFYSIKKGIIRKDWKSIVQMPEFLPYYEMAQTILANKCINGYVSEGFGHRYLKYYDPNLQYHEREEKQFESDLRKKENQANQIPDDYQKSIQMLLDQLAEAQNKIQELNKALINSKTDIKS